MRSKQLLLHTYLHIKYLIRGLTYTDCSLFLYIDIFRIRGFTGVFLFFFCSPTSCRTFASFLVGHYRPHKNNRRKFRRSTLVSKNYPLAPSKPHTSGVERRNKKSAVDRIPGGEREKKKYRKFDFYSKFPPVPLVTYISLYIT